jgi:hypothetical protein
MNRATMRTKALLFVAAVGAANLLAVGVHAQAAYSGPNFGARFMLPYEVHWGKAVLPAGEYSISVTSTGAPPWSDREMGIISYSRRRRSSPTRTKVAQLPPWSSQFLAISARFFR